jgi:hypothetical protein
VKSVRGFSLHSLYTYSVPATPNTAQHQERLQQPAIVETCRGVARALQRGDTYLTEIIGITIAKRVWPENSAEWKEAAKARRVYDYRSTLFVKLAQRGEKAAGEYLTLCAQNRREQNVFLAQLIKAGENPNPPAE